ncbi:MAG: FAD-dependent oxidoreductase, partial [Pseudonocardia sp.]
RLTAAGVEVFPDAAVSGLVTGPGGAVRAVAAADQEWEADAVVLGMGVVPATSVGVSGGLPVGASGGYLPDGHQRVADGVWAAGDCCEIVHRVTGLPTYLPMGTHANKQGRVAGTEIAGGSARFDGAIGTAVTRFVAGDVHVEISRTGLSTPEARAAGIAVRAMVTDGRTASGYMPGAAPMATKVLADRGSRRLVGMQIVGGPGAGKRIDTAAAAIWAGCSVDDLAGMDLAYAPPFATVWEAVQLAGRRLADRL